MTGRALKYYRGRIPACGVFCGGCPVYMRAKKPCPGAGGNPGRCGKSKTFHIYCQERGIANCYQCPAFPCYKFKRFADTWRKYGQDLVENQRLLQQVGGEDFLRHYNSQADYPVSELSQANHHEIMQVWEASVRATHHFLAEEDIRLYRRLIPEKYLDAVRLYGVRDERGMLLGFLGTSDGQIEMLFIHPDARGEGIGRTLLYYAVNALGLRRVDVNEQNEQAVGFYLHAGFTVAGRSQTDGEGKPYPVLHMKLIDNENL